MSFGKPEIRREVEPEGSRPQIKRKTSVEFNIGQLMGLIKLLVDWSNLF